MSSLHFMLDFYQFTLAALVEVRHSEDAHFSYMYTYVLKNISAFNTYYFMKWIPPLEILIYIFMPT